jgi:hypothetical protein
LSWIGCLGSVDPIGQLASSNDELSGDRPSGGHRKTFVCSGVRMEIGANLQINGALEISTVQETVTVTGETPIVDLKDTGKNARLTQETLQSIPSARDPWVMIEQTPT